MTKQSAFDQNHIETSAVSQPEGLLDQLNLPPTVVSFMRANRRMLWIVVSLVVVTVVTVALYDSYRGYQRDQAVSALDAANQAAGDKRVELLDKVVEKYGTTPSGLWARIALSQEDTRKKDFSAAITKLEEVKSQLSEKNPLKPLVLFRLAGLKEQQGKGDAAIALYQELLPFATYAAEAHYAMGRVYVEQGKKPEAVAQYRQYLTLTEKRAGSGAADPVRQRVEYMIKQLQ